VYERGLFSRSARKSSSCPAAPGLWSPPSLPSSLVAVAGRADAFGAPAAFEAGGSNFISQFALFVVGASFLQTVPLCVNHQQSSCVSMPPAPENHPWDAFFP